MSEQESVFTTPWTRQRGRGGTFLASLGLHVLVVFLVLVADYMQPPLELHLAPEQLLAQNRYHVTWFSARNKLPPVTPLEESKPAPARQKGDRARPRFRLPQRVVANDPAAASQRQMIWDPAPAIELKRDVPSPNLLEWTAPKVQRPRFQAVEQQVSAPARQVLEAQAAPRIEPVATTAASPPQVRQPPRLRYQAEEGPTAGPRRQALTTEAAPAVRAAPGQGLDIGQFQKLSRLRYWMPQTGSEDPGRRTLAAGQAPQVQAAPGQTLDVEQFQRLSRLRYRQQERTSGDAEPERRALAADGVAPAEGPSAADGAAGSGGVAELAQAQALASLGAIPPPPALQAGSSRAVVGVDPTPTTIEPPRGRRSGNFTAGPDGGAGATGNGAGNRDEGGSTELAHLRIPHLSVSPASGTTDTTRGASDGGQPNPGGSDPPTADRDTLLRRFREANLSPLPAIAVAVPDRLPDPELPFPGRSVYTLAVNMPNISSYSGSWIIEFAEVKEDKKAIGEILPPSPRLKVDPVYSRAAIDEHIEGEVVLHAMIRSDGLVDYIKVLKGLDDRLDESAKSALSKWRFQPATKNGIPIDVETVVRIPFRLAPPKDERKR